MFYAVIDTNVLVSALLNINSKPGEVLLSVFRGETVPLLNEEIFAEYQTVLAREKFHFPAETVDVILRRMAADGLVLCTDFFIQFIGIKKGVQIDSIFRHQLPG